MKITQEGNQVRFQLMEQADHEWKELFDFKIHKSQYDYLKTHMIEELNKFKVKE